MGWETPRPVQTAVAAAVLASTVAAALSGCDQEPDQAAFESRTLTRASDPAEDAWLDVHDRSEPHVWLASREAGRQLTEDDPAVRATEARLQAASRVFVETPRMVANRAVQASGMLAEHGIVEQPSDIVVRLTAVQAEIGGWMPFGELCQHYLNMRSQGVPAEAALAGRLNPARSAP